MERFGPLSPIKIVIGEQKLTSGDLSVQRGIDLRVCFLNYHYRSVNKLASLGFGMAGSRRFQRPP